jgi:hypothetical protein
MSIRVITGKVRASFVHLFEPQSVKDSAPKYSCSLIIPKSDTVTIGKIREAVEAAKLEGLPLWGGRIPSSLTLPLHDGDLERPDDLSYTGSYYVNANNLEKPDMVDQKCVPITDPRAIYSGCYIRASLGFYPFSKKGNRGVAVSLDNIQKWADGEPLNGRVRAKDEFGALGAEDDEDFLD